MVRGFRSILVLVLGVAFVGQQVVSQALNSACSSNANCATIDNAECSSGYCRCKSGTIEINSRCLEVATALGAGCEDERQCSANLGSNVDCKEFQCSCRPDYVAVVLSNKQSCESKQSLRGSCIAPSQCVLTNFTTCVDNICVCMTGYQNYDDKSCLPDRSYGESCEQHSQCVTRSGSLAGCRGNKCVCEEGNFYNGTSCLTKRGLAETCNGFGEGCYVSNSECVQGTCKCKSGYTESADSKTCSGVGQVFVSIVLLLASVILPSRLS